MSQAGEIGLLLFCEPAQRQKEHTNHSTRLRTKTSLTLRTRRCRPGDADLPCLLMQACPGPQLLLAGRDLRSVRLKPRRSRGSGGSGRRRWLRPAGPAFGVPSRLVLLGAPLQYSPALVANMLKTLREAKGGVRVWGCLPPHAICFQPPVCRSIQVRRRRRRRCRHGSWPLLIHTY